MARRKPDAADFHVIKESGVSIIEDSFLPEDKPLLVSESDIVPSDQQERQTLAVILDDLVAYQDTLEMTQTDEDRAAIREAIERHQAQLIAKVDRYAGMMRRLEFEAQWERAESERHAKRRKRYEAVLQRMEEYAVAAMQVQNVRKLEGQGSALKLRQSPGAVVITEEDAVPMRYKSVTVTMPLDVWENLIAAAGATGGSWRASVATSKDAVKRAIKSGDDVPGADLVFNDSLVLE